MIERIAALEVDVWADGAVLAGVREHLDVGIVRGFTTNPTLMRQAGVTDYERTSRDILEVAGVLPVSIEVLADDLNEMRDQATKIGTWGENVVVKIPVSNTAGQSTGDLVRFLVGDGINVNVTALMTLRQVEQSAGDLQGAAGSYISLFAGRVADTGRDPVPLIGDSLATMAAVGNSKLIWASPREILNVYQAAGLGCHVITVTHDLLRKLDLCDKDLKAYSLETVKMFRDDAVAAGFVL